MEECLAAYEWSYDVARERDIKVVLDLGDVFHDRTHVDAYTHSRVYQSSRKARKDGVKTHFLLGNHDMYFRFDRKASSILAFEALGSVVNEPCTMEVLGFPCDFFPYVEDAPGPELAEAFPRGKRSRILFFHAAIEGAVMNSASGKVREIEGAGCEDLHEDEIKECISPKFLDGWELALGGHYHMSQVVCEDPCKVMYAGSPIQHSYGEAGEEKGLWTLDLETLEMERIPNTFSPRFLAIDLGREDSLGDIDVENCRVRARMEEPSAKLINKIRKQALNVGALSFRHQVIRSQRVDRKLHGEHITSAAASVQDGRAMIRRWVKLHHQADLVKDNLVEVGYGIVAEASSSSLEEDTLEKA
jgi:DNA repair exonuclease SbcCD nuclease subunit